MSRKRASAEIQPRGGRGHGFTLIELLMVVVVVAILAMVGIPSFVSLNTKMRMDGEISALAGTLNLARSAASQRGEGVSLCANSGTACQSQNSWTNGWQTVVTGTATQLSLSSGVGNGDTLTSTLTTYPQFTPLGYTFFNGTLSLHDSNSTPSLYRCIVFNAGAWTIVTGATCP